MRLYDVINDQVSILIQKFVVRHYVNPVKAIATGFTNTFVIIIFFCPCNCYEGYTFSNLDVNHGTNDKLQSIFC